MMKQTMWWFVLILVFVPLFASAPVSAQGRRGSAPEIEAKAVSVLTRMAEFVSNTERFSVTIDIGFDVVQEWGQKIEFGETRNIVVQRPNRLRVDTTKRNGKTRGVVFSGQEIAVFDVEEKVYATVAQPGTLDETTNYFLNGLQMRLPLANLLLSNFSQIMQARIRHAYYIEEATLAGVVCDQIAVVGYGADLQVWVAKGDQPLPQRVVISYWSEAGEPQFRAQFKAWNLSPNVSDSHFMFTPPDGAARIVFAPLMRATAGQEK